MSKKLDPSPVEIEGGTICRKCRKPMQRYQHSTDWRPQPGRNYYAYWDRCRPCGHFQNYEAAKVICQ